jgi:hypothetical protein
MGEAHRRANADSMTRLSGPVTDGQESTHGRFVGRAGSRRFSSPAPGHAGESSVKVISHARRSPIVQSGPRKQAELIRQLNEREVLGFVGAICPPTHNHYF